MIWLILLILLLQISQILFDAVIAEHLAAIKQHLEERQ